MNASNFNVRANLIKINDKTHHLKKGIYGNLWNTERSWDFHYCCAFWLLWLTWRSPRKPFPQYPPCGSSSPASGKDSQAWKFCCYSRCDPSQVGAPSGFYLPVAHLTFDKGTRPVLQQWSCSSLSLNCSPFAPLHFLSFCIALSRNADEEGEGWL